MPCPRSCSLPRSTARCASATDTAGHRIRPGAAFGRSRQVAPERRAGTGPICYNNHLVHGLLQTPDYTRGLNRNFAVETRLRRQRLLQRIRVDFFLEESVLHRLVGNRAVMHDQLMHLLLSPATVRGVPIPCRYATWTALSLCWKVRISGPWSTWRPRRPTHLLAREQLQPR
ncbi:Scr1 family TA system antitoxin-like transcriptional regulator [Saccharothrix lopnurensis]|uniref:Scr1 family TA system antitoxin-like transcriptional regulator n=1 Tax=Saccharothrix lopnurensis TaxID=1670621 RepID=A0ABW1P3Q5_9PSEU